MNIIARLEYELAYYDSAVHHFNHYTTRTPQYNGNGVLSFTCWYIHLVNRYLSQEEPVYSNGIHVNFFDQKTLRSILLNRPVGEIIYLWGLDKSHFTIFWEWESMCSREAVYLHLHKCKTYQRRKWYWRSKFKPCTQLFAFHVTLMPLKQTWNQLFSPVN